MAHRTENTDWYKNANSYLLSMAAKTRCAGLGNVV